MRPYFEKMVEIGKPLSQAKKRQTEENVTQVKEVEKQLREEIEKVKNAGLPAKKINERGQLTVWQRLEYLVDPAHGALFTLFSTPLITRKEPPTWWTVWE